MNFTYILILCLLAFLVYKFFFSKLKLPKIGAITLFTGGVKTGKSAVSLYFAIKTYKRTRFRWKLSCFFVKFINVFLSKSKQKELPEEPLFYSTIPIANMKFVLLTRDHFLRNVRFNFKSVVFIDEASLVADSMLVKDGVINSQLLLFFKLFGHETHGGSCIINSHCITDLHFAIKRTTSQYFYIHSMSKYLFFNVARMREERYSEDGTAINNYNNDLEESLVNVFLWTNIFKRYDTFAFSYLTDHLPICNNEKFLTRHDSLKANQIPSFRPEFYNLLEKEHDNAQKID